MWSAACQTEKGAPTGSRNIAIRPSVMTSIGSTTVVPPAPATLAVASSALATETYVVQYGRPGPVCGPSPATDRPLYVQFTYPPVSGDPSGVSQPNNPP